MSVVAVTFDYWNTLVRRGAAGPLRLRAVADALAAAGHAVADPAVEGALGYVRDRQDASWRAGVQYRIDDALPELFDVVGIDAAPAVVEQVREAWIDSGRRAPVELVEPDGRVAEALDRLRAHGVAVGIVSDVGLIPSPVLRGHLERHGVLSRFDHWSFSDETGAYKPADAAFRIAFDGLGVDDPARVVHLGDLHRTDVAGARAAGAGAVRYRGVEDDPDAPTDDPGPVVDTLAAFVDLIERW